MKNFVRYHYGLGSGRKSAGTTRSRILNGTGYLGGAIVIARGASVITIQVMATVPLALGVPRWTLSAVPVTTECTAALRSQS